VTFALTAIERALADAKARGDYAAVRALRGELEAYMVSLPTAAAVYRLLESLAADEAWLAICSTARRGSARNVDPNQGGA